MHDEVAEHGVPHLRELEEQDILRAAGADERFLLRLIARGLAGEQGKVRIAARQPELHEAARLQGGGADEEDASVPRLPRRHRGRNERAGVITKPDAERFVASRWQTRIFNLRLRSRPRRSSRLIARRPRRPRSCHGLSLRPNRC